MGYPAVYRGMDTPISRTTSGTAFTAEPFSYPVTADPGDALACSFTTSYAGVIAFITVAAEGNFARAGDRLGIGRSAVSRSVQKLEDQLGIRLFVRTTRRTTLTREGERFYENCRAGVKHIVQALDEMRELRAGPPAGPLRIRAATGFGRHVVAPLLGGFHHAYPEVTVELILGDGPADFTRDRIDVAFHAGRLSDSRLIAKPLIPMQRVLCASVDYADRHGLPQHLEDLAQHQCINLRLPSGRIYEWEFLSGADTRRLTPTATLTFNDSDLVRQAVVNGQGLAQLPAELLSEPLRNGTLVPCLSHCMPAQSMHYICYMSRQHLAARIRAFIDYMSAEIRTRHLPPSH